MAKKETGKMRLSKVGKGVVVAGKLVKKSRDIEKTGREVPLAGERVRHLVFND